MIYCFLLFNIMFENNVLSLVIDEIRFNFFYKACDLLTNRKFKRLLVNKFILMAEELSSMKTYSHL